MFVSNWIVGLVGLVGLFSETNIFEFVLACFEADTEGEVPGEGQTSGEILPCGTGEWM